MQLNKKWFILLLSGLLIAMPKTAYAMHIMEGYLPWQYSVFWAVLCVPFLVAGMKSIREKTAGDQNMKLLLGMVGGFVFVLSALKIPSVTGSCSHPTGAGLGAIFFGPTAMTVVGLIVLLFQALLLAHGGITTLGANAFSMAVVGPFVAYGLYKGLQKLNVNKKVSVFVAAFSGNLLTYCVTSLQLGIAFPDATTGVMGSVLQFLGIFAITQVPLAIVEGLLSVVVFNLIMDYSQKGVLSLEKLY